MNYFILAANVLTLLAFAIHAFVGDKELKINEPNNDQDSKHEKREKWTMARCAWQWVSFDLLFASIGLAIINFTDYLGDEKLLLNILSVYFAGYALAWIMTIAISKQFPKNFVRLGQWILLLLISGLIYWGAN